MKHMTLFLISIFFLIPTSTFGIYMVNPAIHAYDCNATQVQTMDSLIVKGAASILKSNADYLLFAQRFELNSSDCVAFQEPLTSAIDNLSKTIEAYNIITSIAPLIPYNPTIINKLIAFDYTGFQQEKGLFGDVFFKVRAFLVKGDVNGSLIDFYNQANNLLTLLNLAKQDLEKGISPNITKLWDIHQKYNELMVFGLYESMVLNAIK